MFKEQMADVVASTAHAAVGQFRKYSDEPYIVHPRDVAEIVKSYGGNTIQIQAALLHDVVEDTALTVEFVSVMFGKEVERQWIGNI